MRSAAERDWLDPGGAAATLATLGPGALVVTEPEPWAILAGPALSPARVVEPPGVALEALESLAARLGSAERVIGIGGGTALDTAKFLAWKRALPLILIPSILSVDAAFTHTAGVRVDGRVRYLGEVTATRIVVDPELIRRAPARLNRAGVGDLLSCHTALRDWELAEAEGHPAGPRVEWDPELADLGRSLVTEVSDAAEAIARVSDAGIRVLASAFARVGAACRRAGHARFEEGSEHFFAYALEARTGRRLLHGELVAFATLALAVLQDHEPGRVASVIRRSRVRADPAGLGIDASLFASVASGLAAYVRAEDLWWSVLDREPIDEARARGLFEETKRWLGNERPEPQQS